MLALGIETYNEALGDGTSQKGERDAIALVSSDEVLIRRFWGFQFAHVSGVVADTGVALIVSDRQLLVLKAAGFLRTKIDSWTFPYGQLKENVARNQYELVPGSKPYYVTGFARLNSDACVATFLEERDRDAFAAILQAAIDAHYNGHTMSPEELASARDLLR